VLGLVVAMLGSLGAEALSTHSTKLSRVDIDVPATQLMQGAKGLRGSGAEGLSGTKGLNQLKKSQALRSSGVEGPRFQRAESFESLGLKEEKELGAKDLRQAQQLGAKGLGAEGLRSSAAPQFRVEVVDSVSSMALSSMSRGAPEHHRQKLSRTVEV